MYSTEFLILDKFSSYDKLPVIVKLMLFGN